MLQAPAGPHVQHVQVDTNPPCLTDAQKPSSKRRIHPPKPSEQPNKYTCDVGSRRARNTPELRVTAKLCLQQHTLVACLHSYRCRLNAVVIIVMLHYAPHSSID
jgi:hypothetical protein